MADDTDRARVWRAHVAAWRDSGQSQRAYAEKHGIGRWALGRWVRRLAEEAVSAPCPGDIPRDIPMTPSAPVVMEVLAEAPRRQRWSAAEKRRLVAETFEPGMSVSLVARRRGVDPSLLFRWRRQLTSPPPSAPALPTFAPVQLEPEASAAEPTAREPTPGLMEIVLANGRVVRVDRHVDAAALRRVLGVLEGSP